MFMTALESNLEVSTQVRESFPSDLAAHSLLDEPTAALSWMHTKMFNGTRI